MPSDVFKRIDTRYLAAALSDNTTHAGIGTFEMTLGLSTDGNKGERANQVIQHIFAAPDTDALVIDLLNYLFVENPYAITNSQNPTFTHLNEKVLEPRGVALTDNGYALPDGRDADSLERVDRTPAPSPNESGENTILPPAGAGFAIAADQTAPTTTRAISVPVQAAPPAAVGSERHRDKVFVVHGRDTRPVEVLKQYLLFLGLHVMPWSEARDLTRTPQPHTYDIVMAGMTHAAAIIVIFSPDDLARVKDDFSEAGDPDRTPSGQARQNVILEAGMAFAMAPERTIFLQSQRTRSISDIDGFNWVKLDGEWDSRLDLKKRLEGANALVRPGNYNLKDPLAGPFSL